MARFNLWIQEIFSCLQNVWNGAFNESIGPFVNCYSQNEPLQVDGFLIALKIAVNVEDRSSSTYI